MSKQALPQSFELQGFIYNLVYFPNPQDLNQISPNFGLMKSVDSNVEEVHILDGRGKPIRKFITWIRTVIPATAMSPEKNFLLFGFFDTPTPAEIIAPENLICYSMQQKNKTDGNLTQQFVNCIFGLNTTAQNEPQAVKTSWASEMFTIEKKDAETGVQEVKGVVSDDDSAGE